MRILTRLVFLNRGPGIDCTGPGEVLLEVLTLVFQEFFINKYFIVEIL